MDNKLKNIKISKRHHEILKRHCDKQGLKIYKVVEKWIDSLNVETKKNKDIYDES